MARPFDYKKNEKLKKAIYREGKSMKTVAEDMEINYETFNKKINHNRHSGGVICSFSKCERYYLSQKFGLLEEEIE